VVRYLLYVFFAAAFEKIQDYVREEERGDLDDFLVSFRFYFVIVEESSYILTVLL
jgi:hypothetical protein